MSKKSAKYDDVSENPGRREFIRRAGYAAPVLLSLDAVPSFAQQGSSAGSHGGGGTGPEPPVSTGPRPASEFNCESPMQPIDSDVAVSMCEITQANDGTDLFQDIIVRPEQVPDSIARGNVLDTCDNFVCSAS